MKRYHQRIEFIALKEAVSKRHDSIVALLSTLALQTDHEERRLSVALGRLRTRLRSQATVPLLRELATCDTDEAVKERAVALLGEIEKP